MSAARSRERQQHQEFERKQRHLQKFFKKSLKTNLTEVYSILTSQQD